VTDTPQIQFPLLVPLASGGSVAAAKVAIAMLDSTE
jgi:hypothetical protein